MGEQVPVKDELERALASMRAGFLSGSSQIATGIASLEEHLAEAPREEREKARAAMAQVVATQERLIAHIERLPGQPWDRFKSMVGILKAQQAILDDLGDLVKEHVLPRQLQGLSVAAASAAAPAPVPAPAPPPPRRRAADAGSGPPERVRKGTGLKGLAAMVVAALVLSLIPRESKLQEAAAKLFALVGGGGESAPADASNAKTAAVEPRKAPGPAPRVPQEPEEGAAANQPPAAPPAPSDEKRASGKPATDATAAADRPAKVALAQPGGKRGAAPAEKPAVKASPEQFVPVLFTHRDQETVLRTMSDLQQQHPKLLMDRKGEIQPVNLGKKGIWHRLVLLPAGPRPEATKLCDQLMAEGYDRCWVWAYEGAR
jgi:hypothetical protein